MKAYNYNLFLLDIESDKIERYPTIELENVDYFTLSVQGSDKLRYSYREKDFHVLKEINSGIHTTVQFIDFCVKNMILFMMICLFLLYLKKGL